MTAATHRALQERYSPEKWGEIRAALKSHQAWLKISQTSLHGDAGGPGPAQLQGIDLAGVSLRALRLDGADLRGCSLVGADLKSASFRGANLAEADLSDADAGGADFTGADLTQARLCRARLGQAGIVGGTMPEPAISARPACLAEADLTGADLTEADLSGAVLALATFDGAMLRQTSLARCDLRSTRFSAGTILELAARDIAGARFMEDRLPQALWQRLLRLGGARLERLRTLAPGELADLVAIHERFLETNSQEGFKLALSGVTGAGLSLAGRSLVGADFECCDLPGLDAQAADLKVATFRGCTLQRARFNGADLRGASFALANLTDADFRRARLASFRHSDANQAFVTEFRRADLTRVLGEHAVLTDTHGVRPPNFHGATNVPADWHQHRDGDMAGPDR